MKKEKRYSAEYIQYTINDSKFYMCRLRTRYIVPHTTGSYLTNNFKHYPPQIQRATSNQYNTYKQKNTSIYLIILSELKTIPIIQYHSRTLRTNDIFKLIQYSSFLLCQPMRHWLIPFFQIEFNPQSGLQKKKRDSGHRSKFIMKKKIHLVIWSWQ